MESDIQMNTSIIGALLKIIYVIPFINYYLISKRESSKQIKLIIIGFILILINFLLIITGTLLIDKGTITLKELNNKLLFFQLIFNLFLLSSYLTLMISIYNYSHHKLSINNVISLIMITALISTLLPPNLLLIINSVTYTLAIYFLINSLIIMGLMFNNYEKRYYLTIIGAIILIIDPILFIKTYSTAISININQGIEVIYRMRLIIYLIGLTAMITILAPNISLFIKLRKREQLIKGNSSIDLKIKKLMNGLQSIYGAVAGNVLKKTMKELYNDKSYKDLSDREKKQLLKKLEKELANVFSKRIINRFK